jgi:hypothetical protein
VELKATALREAMVAEVPMVILGLPIQVVEAVEILRAL